MGLQFDTGSEDLAYIVEHRTILRAGLKRYLAVVAELKTFRDAIAGDSVRKKQLGAKLAANEPVLELADLNDELLANDSIIQEILTIYPDLAN